MEIIQGLTFFGSEFRHLIDVLTGVPTVRDAEPKVKIKGLE